MQRSFPPCPACGGTQAFFNGEGGHASIRLPFNKWTGEGVTLGALICLECGHTELRPHPEDMARLRARAEKQGPVPPLS